MLCELNTLLQTYPKVMILKMFVDSADQDLRNKYIGVANIHNNKIINNNEYIDAGFDLFSPGFVNLISIGNLLKLDLNVICSAKIYTQSGKSYNTGYYMYPRSSISKTPLRLANSTGIIDAGYRGHLIGVFDVLNKQNINDILTINNTDDCDEYNVQKFDRYLQICAPGLIPILVEIVNKQSDLGAETERGAGGFGSTGK